MPALHAGKITKEVTKMTWKKFKQIDEKFFNFTKPKQPTAENPGTWGLTDVYKLEDILVKHDLEYEVNCTQLDDKNDAETLADSLASRFGYTSLVGTLGRWSGYFTPPKKEGDDIVAEYNLESVFHSDYARHVEYRANTKTGKVTIKYICDADVPEDVIAKDLHRLYKTLDDRKGYFAKNAKADDKKDAKDETPAKTDNEAKAEKKSPAEKPKTETVKDKLDVSFVPKELQAVFQEEYGKFKASYDGLKKQYETITNYVEHPEEFYKNEFLPAVKAAQGAAASG